ncbi:MAG TPA: Clp protease N-terminal domain-containing protein [Candidatus Dormibacteraeota bacterium]|nr:Clp protease N-terminal domain-containing protein [Candidatus Dormibacteraeota bacterium]
MYPFERFTEGAKQALTRAQEEAVAANLPYIGTEHLALALARDDGVAGRILRDLGVTYEGMKAQIGSVLDSAEKPGPARIIPTSRVKRVMEVALQEATSAGAEHVGTEHLLAALLVEAEGVAAQAFDELGATLPKVRRAIRAGLGDRAAQRAGIIEASSVAQQTGNPPVPGAPVGTSSSLGVAMMRAGQLAKEEGSTDIRADHLIRAIAATDTADLRGTLDKLGLAPEATVRALTVPEEIRRLGLAAQSARVEHAAAFAAGGVAATHAVEEAMRRGREYSEAVSRWLGEGHGP